MNKKSAIFIALLIFISLAIFTSASFAEDEDRSYSIPFANIHLYIQENGSLHIVETIHYSFSGTYNGVTRDIPFKSDETIKNLNVSTSGAYSTFTSNDEDGEKHIKVYLYSNPEKTIPVTDTEVDVTYEYDFINVVKLYNDGATLHYTLWGDGWDVDLGKLYAHVHLNNNSGVKYWLNPSALVSNDKWNNNTLEITTNELRTGDLFELRMILPKNYFNNPIYALQYNENGTIAFETLQHEYENGVNFFGSFYQALAIAMLLSCLVPILIYIKYGREPKISYQGIYEHEPPTDDDPATVNALYNGEIGLVDMNAFKATILDLVNKKYLKMSDFERSYKVLEDGEEPKSPSIIFNDDLDKSKLTKSEKSALKLLKFFAYEDKSRLDLTNFQNDMNEEVWAKNFRKKYDDWCSEVQNEVNSYIDDLFIFTGNTLSSLFAVIGFILSVIILVLMLFRWLPFYYVDSVLFLSIASFILLFICIMIFLLPNELFGRWTVKGREKSKKWRNFRKYLNEFSLIKEYPPSSLSVWNQYLVYATALGTAKNVQKAMEKLIPKETLDTSDSYMFYTYGGTYMIFSSFDSGISTASSSDSGNGGSGGFGGGSGGGGGGAF